MSNWNHLYLQQLANAPFAQLDQLFGLSRMATWPNAQGLNQLALELGIDNLPSFTCQSELAQEQDYYEQIIFRQGKVPTRPDNWHDLFNALIWMLFPQSKKQLNQLHIEDIQQHGLTPRTSRRDRITHFDECGVVLMVKDTELLDLLRQHQWQQVFIENRAAWGRDIQPLVFGHANYEMLLQPFRGLTGKWLAVQPDAQWWQMDVKSQYREADRLLVDVISQLQPFEHRGRLLPLPLLGIPGWYEANRDPQYYLDTDYFRPKRIRTA